MRVPAKRTVTQYQGGSRVKDYCQGESLGRIKVKGKGEMEIFRVLGLRA
jgi:hypothetical protein